MLLFTGHMRDVFFVSAAERKSQKTGELPRQNAAFCVLCASRSVLLFT